MAAKRILAEVRPDIVVLNAGATTADGPVGPDQLGGFHRNLGNRRQGWPLLDPGGAQSAAQAGKPRHRRSSGAANERIAALGAVYAGAERMLWFMA